MNIRLARSGDSAALLRIYAQYIDTPVTFEYTLPSENEFAARIGAISAEYPYLVCEEDGETLGYAYAHRQAEREAYQWNAELSVYLDPASTSRGIGARLYRMLLDILLLQGVRTAYALVTLPNRKSERLHASLGRRSQSSARPVSKAADGTTLPGIQKPSLPMTPIRSRFCLWTGSVRSGCKRS